VKHHLGRRVAEAGWKMEDGNSGARTVDVAHCWREFRLVLPAVIQRNLVTESVEQGHDMRSDEVGATYEEHPHTSLVPTT
jgi:hypothetical protein